LTFLILIPPFWPLANNSGPGYNLARFSFQETGYEGIDYITVVGDIVSAVLAGGAGGAYIVACCVAAVDTVSDCGDSGGGVFGFD